MDRPGHCIETYSAGSTRQSKGQLVRGPAEIIYDQAAAVGGRLSKRIFQEQRTLAFEFLQAVAAW